MMNVRFEKCECDPEMPLHGYLHKGKPGTPRLNVIILSANAGRHLVEKNAIDLDGMTPDELERQILAAGLPQKAEHDIRVVIECLSMLAEETILTLVVATALLGDMGDLDDAVQGHC